MADFTENRHVDQLFLPSPSLPGPEELVHWPAWPGCASPLALINAALQASGPLVVVHPHPATLHSLRLQCQFFSANNPNLPLLFFPDWETLPYDPFAPHADLISERCACLHQLPSMQRGLVFVSVPTAMGRLAPKEYFSARMFSFHLGQTLTHQQLRDDLSRSAYRIAQEVLEPGECAFRGSIVDIFPMGTTRPLRLDFDDDILVSLRTFDPETQCSLEKIDRFSLLPAREFPLDSEGIGRFRHRFRDYFPGDPTRVPLYQSVTQGLYTAGLEYYLPLFFETTATLLDYLPPSSTVVLSSESDKACEQFWHEIEYRYDQLRHDRTRPLLPPQEMFVPLEEWKTRLQNFSRVLWDPTKTDPSIVPAPSCLLRRDDTVWPSNEKILLSVESPGRREAVETLLTKRDIVPRFCERWEDFVRSNETVHLTVAPLEKGAHFIAAKTLVLTESELFGEHVQQRRLRLKTRRGRQAMDAVRDLVDLEEGSPIVHIDHGVGRYRGLHSLVLNETPVEFLLIEYQDAAKLYVPVSDLHLISRYNSGSLQEAPWHRLGTAEWERAKKKALDQIRDVAAELLRLYAAREAKQGFRFKRAEEDFEKFSEEFPFEETPDQLRAIDEVVQDLCSERPMDRVVCGDVGFGKTEVAMRAAFLAAHNQKQVAVLVPTTLLAEQHTQTFRDRFAKWPIRIAGLSRFQSSEEQKKTLQDLREGKLDIVIGTHKLLQKDIHFHDLGLLIVDEEHRFGVQHKERMKALRAEVDILTLTATPIPRTLHMALAHLRDLSLIATPPPDVWLLKRSFFRGNRR